MFGLDDMIANLSDGTTFGIVMVVAVLLGLRHATDPDHLAAVSTVVAGGEGRPRWVPARLGFAWGCGHAATLFAFGLPIVLYTAYLPARAQQGAEVFVGLLIIALAAWLLARWWLGSPESRPTRSAAQAFGIGLVHGVGGSAGVGAILLATIHDRALAVAGLVVLAVFTAASMTAVTSVLGVTLSSAPVGRSLRRVVPVLGVASLGFGAWYALGALELAPYYF
jgi:hypothetical protein